jgi:hypothetical protein
MLQLEPIQDGIYLVHHAQDLIAAIQRRHLALFGLVVLPDSIASDLLVETDPGTTNPAILLVPIDSAHCIDVTCLATPFANMSFDALGIYDFSLNHLSHHHY